LIGGSKESGLKALPDALHEAELVGSQFDKPTVITGRAATLEAVEHELPSANVFHFAGHAVMSSGGAGLVLATADRSNDSLEAQLLDANRLYGRRLRQSQLVVLSACATTASGTSGLAAPESLVRAFLRAGVPHVVASDWNVDSGVTASFMKDFYAALFSGKKVPAALEEASEHIRRQPATQHPYYWSAFVAFGSA
jgi:CHAT domain-containing protein